MHNDSEGLVAYCGLYCGDCFSHKGEIADLARDLRKKLRQEKFSSTAQGLSKYFKALNDYETCYEVLGAMVKLRCKRGCRDGGGNPWCKIRKCCQEKQIDGCWECSDFEECGKFDFLKTVHEDANLKNLRRIKRNGLEEFVGGKRDW